MLILNNKYLILNEIGNINIHTLKIDKLNFKYIKNYLKIPVLKVRNIYNF